MKSAVFVSSFFVAILIPEFHVATPSATFDFDEHLIVPVRVHLLRAKELPSVDCKLTEKDVHRVFSKATRIWHQAGIHLYLESIVDEEAENSDAFKELGDTAPLSAYRQLRPKASRDERMFHVYYVHKLAVNGVFLDRSSIFVKDTASLREVEGGIDEPLPRVTSHELGHGFRLPHRQATTNLMASGTTGTSLNESEIETVRMAAHEMDFVQRAEQAIRIADQLLAEGKRNEAKRLYETIASIPGESNVKKKAKHMSETMSCLPIDSGS